MLVCDLSFSIMITYKILLKHFKETGFSLNNISNKISMLGEFDI